MPATPLTAEVADAMLDYLGFCGGDAVSVDRMINDHEDATRPGYARLVLNLLITAKFLRLDNEPPSARVRLTEKGAQRVLGFSGADQPNCDRTEG